ncbi:hypothetical protein HD806DRAFT_43371 [Xylariaceae sp. AK1471]|nr:hypothetical protein HD806DRAFT_43371 [Xylariaceae sp. AK1471]
MQAEDSQHGYMNNLTHLPCFVPSITGPEGTETLLNPSNEISCPSRSLLSSPSPIHIGNTDNSDPEGPLVPPSIGHQSHEDRVSLFHDKNRILRKPVAPVSQGKTASMALDKGSSRDQGPRVGKKAFLLMWKWEFLNCFLLIVAIFGILATLYPHAGQPQPQWPFSITINALLSVYAVWFRASAVFVTAAGIAQLQWHWLLQDRSLSDITSYDDAGRGPWGSFNMLLKHRARQPLSALGAAIIIVCIAVDPFTQQLVSTVDCNLFVEDMRATISRTNFFNGPESRFAPRYRQIVPAVLRSEVISGLYAEDHPPSFDCFTGNCTFEEKYASVGFCSSCREITDQIKESVLCYGNGHFTYGEDCHPNPFVNHTFSIDDNLSLNWTFINGDRGPPYTIFTTQVDTLHKVSFNGTVYETGRDIRMLLAKPRAVFGDDIVTNEPLTECDNHPDNTSWACTGRGAAICQVQPCVREYKGSIQNGKLVEDIVDQSDINEPWGLGFQVAGDESSNTTDEKGSPFMSLVDLHCVSPSDLQTLAHEGYNISSSGRWLPYSLSEPFHGTVQLDAPFPQSMQAAGCVYIVNQDALIHIWDNLLKSLLSGTVIFEDAQALAKAYQSLDGSPEALTIFDAGRFDMDRAEYIARQVADSLTQHARSNGQANHSAAAIGRVAHYAVCIQVNWPWIGLPAGIAVLVLLFFGLTLWDTWVTRAPVWKSSPLAIFFHGPGGATWLTCHETVGAANPQLDLYKTKDMEKVADLTTIRLVTDREKSGAIQLFQTGNKPLEPEVPLRSRVYRAMNWRGKLPSLRRRRRKAVSSQKVPNWDSMSRDSLESDD